MPCPKCSCTHKNPCVGGEYTCARCGFIFIPGVDPVKYYAYTQGKGKRPEMNVPQYFSHSEMTKGGLHNYEAIYE